jgi:squalene synthase HpnC
MTVETAGENRELIERGWAALPAEYRIPDRIDAQRPSLEQARAYCHRLATTHYENFHVASWFLPARLRSHFYSIYAYCRIADDLGDEVGNREQSLALLDLWGRELDACYAGEARHPVFVALAETIRSCDIPQKPFADLLVAFRQDQNVLRYQTMEEVLDYCTYSANPVGRLVLYACGYRDPERFRLSDDTCTALQLANFWQDVSSDFDRGRIYLPLQDMRQYHVEEATIARRDPTPAFRELLRYEVDYARRLFSRGLPLVAMVDRELALDLDLFSRGGLEILRAIERRHYDVLTARPAISKARKFALLARALIGKAGLTGRGRSS